MFHLRFGLSDLLKALPDFVFGSRRRVKKVRIFRAWFSHYWILELLRIRRAPRWLYAYAKFVLFHRRVSHKVQERLLPSRTIMQGVDMGRFFSVYLFCLAMDPLFTYLNRIPVLSRSRVTLRTTIAGNTQCLGWLEEVAHTY